MDKTRQRGLYRWQQGLALILLGLVVTAGWTGPVEAQTRFTPDHPEVRRMVRSGVSYLRQRFGGNYGETVLHGLAILNSYEDLGYLQDAEVNRAVQLVLSSIPQYRQHLEDSFDGHNLRGVTNESSQKHFYQMYEPCVALMLLVEYDSERYTNEIRTLIDFIVRRQMPTGGWTYNHHPTGDTSQAQYCCLALWLAHHKGFDIPDDHAMAAVGFWTRSQAADGSWGYQIVEGARLASPHMSLAAAGGGSLYMLGEILGVNPPARRAAQRSDELYIDLPSFVERLTEEEARRLAAEQARARPADRRPQIEVAGLNAAKDRINRWFGQNFRTETSHWAYYALYGFERYATFREKIDGDVPEVPDWYDQGVDYIKEHQGGDGAMPADSHANSAVHTSLAILFLVRSTLRLTQMPRDASLEGNRGLGRNVAIRGNKVISEDEKRDIAELLNLVKKDMSPDELADIAESFRNVAVTSIKDKSKAQQLMLLREMVENEHWEIRVVAVRALGQVRMIDNCPALIFALSDPDPRVVQEASISLQFVSRKTETPPVPQVGLVNGQFDTQDSDYQAAIRELYNYWADWYVSLKPDAQLLPVSWDNR